MISVKKIPKKLSCFREHRLRFWVAVVINWQTRSKMKGNTKILEVFRKYNIRYFLYNGGNDSMDTCDKIARYLSKMIMSVVS